MFIFKDFDNGFSKHLGLPALASQSKVQRNFIWFPILAFIIMVVGIAPVEALSWILWKNFNTDPLLDMTVFALGLSHLSVIALVYFVVTFREKRQFADLGFYLRDSSTSVLFGHWFIKYAIGFFQGILLMLLLAFVIYQFGGFELVMNSDLNDGIENIGWTNLPHILFILGGWLIQGATEEIVVRGWMLPLLASRYNVPFAIIVSSLFFVSLHLFNGGIDFLPLLNLWLYGIFASLYVIKAQSLWAICGLHSAWNWVQGNILGVLVSGNSVIGGSIIALFPIDESWLSGGDFGIEGSLITSILFIVLILYLTRVLIKQTPSVGQIKI